MRKLLSVIALLLIPVIAGATEDRLVKIDTRPGESISFWLMNQEGAKATLLLLPGHDGGVGMKNGVPASKDFLVRSRQYFAANGFNVAILGKPSDHPDLDALYRISLEHIEDLRFVTAWLKKSAGRPVWIVGTSRGTISATSAAIAFGNQELAGVVLTSSVTSSKMSGAVPFQKIELIKIPTLVLHHEYDSCKICVPADAVDIVRGLKNASIKKSIFVKGGSNVAGEGCSALKSHGYFGMEEETVKIISDWIKNPVN